MSVKSTNVLPPLPVEIWTMIICQLDKKTWKSLRLISRLLHDVATPFCFETVRFDLVEELPLRHLMQIAIHQRLRYCVKRLVLQRRYGLQKLPSFTDFKRHLLFSDKTSRWMCQNDVPSYDPMTRAEWNSLSKEAQINIYEEYTADYNQLKQKARRLTRFWQFRILGPVSCAENIHQSTSSDETPTLVDKMMQHLDKAFRAFKNLREFSHEPAYVFDKTWGCHWRRLPLRRTCAGFDIDNSLLGSFYDYRNDGAYIEDRDVEALQLSLVLRALGWADYLNRNLKSTKLFVDELNFLSAKELYELWQCEHELSAGFRDSSFGRVMSMSGLDIFRYGQQIRIMEEAFVSLTKVDCVIRAGRSVDKEHIRVFNQVIRLLGRCKYLTSLRLGIRCRVHYWSDDSLPRRRFFNQLANLRPWRHIRELSLIVECDQAVLLRFLSSMAFTLRRLSLQLTTILGDNSSLESFFIKMGRLLQLDVLNLSCLQQRRPCFNIMNKNAVVWYCGVNIERFQASNLHSSEFYGEEVLSPPYGGNSLSPCYEHYESAIIKAILEKRDTLPPLRPLAFMRKHCDECPTFQAQLEKEIGLEVARKRREERAEEGCVKRLKQ